ncbi:MAG: tetratricopeptide repeat protein [Deltaproteobacteria bacterium]|nr:tetratricopeptide repeat protein [Deltaproteobacteria bacterium]
MVDTPTLSELEARLAAVSISPGHHVQRIDALTELAWELRNNDVPRSNALATEARQLALEHEYTLGQARAARTMAMTISDTHALGDVFRLGEEARALFDQTDDDAGRAASRDFLASVHEHIGDYAAGLAWALEALSIARELGDPIRQGYALSNVGGILAASGEVDAAITHLEEALELFEGSQDAGGVGTICSRLSRVLKDAGQVEEALAYAKRCHDTAEATQSEFLQCTALTVMAQLEDKRGRLADAERLYRAAISSVTTQPGRNVVGSEAQVALGGLLIRQGAFEDAEVELNDALVRIEDDSVSIVTEAAAHQTLAELCELQGKLREAVGHLRKGQVLRERISQQDARSKLAQVEARALMEATKKDAEIHKLRFVELHGMQAKLVEAEKMAFLGTLAAGTAHELNTPVGVLRSNIELSSTATKRLVALVHGGDLGEQATKLAALLESCRATNDEAVQRIAAVAESFKRFSQLDQAERRLFDVREGLDSAIALLEPTISDAITFERHFHEVPEIEGWPRALNHAFMTVLQNAAQAIHGAGVISVETGVAQNDVLVRVRDTGRGMTEEQTAHLFDVAWSEGGTRTRMRLGLSAAYSTVQKHHGTIEIQSVLGEGTVVSFRFPNSSL